MMCSGGDLDGDIYTVIWDDLIPKKEFKPFDYQSIEKSNKEMDEIKIPDIIDWIFEYLTNDNLGKISNHHAKFADEKGADHPISIAYAIEHSKAVDYPKTGIPGKILEKVSHYPSWNNKYPYYTSSQSTIQKMNLLVKEINEDNIDLFTDNNYEIKQEFIIDGYKDYLEDAKTHYNYYTNILGRIMMVHHFSNEFDVLNFNFSHLKRENIKSIQYEIISLLDEIDERFNLNLDEKERKKKASAWYIYAYEKKRFISFGWIGYKDLLN